ncbi:UNVERIFIED_CONTAM: Chloroplastic group IIA intron splicing facilitator CRS1, chloroplastic [Sesamum angustifolium]|uniref:Chloroplastic group IIA intron splicing facilitator CRS1, chloroplastic n=1 Tax=Sesamum angustifolium TaxID=2727405 RepID=A0AAW2NLG3_9LAMI
MSTSPSLSHFSITVSPFPYNPAKVPTSSITFCPPKFNFTVFSSSPTNGSNSTKVEGRSIEHERMDCHVKSSEPISHSVSAIKAPTAPWMNGPLLVKPNEIMGFRKSRTNRESTFGENRKHPDLDLTGKVGGGRGKVAMKKIFKGIEKLQENQNLEETRKDPENLKFRFAPGALWGDGDCENGAEIEEKSEAQESWESNGFDIPLPEVEKEVKSKEMPWQRDERMVIRMVKKEKVVRADELGLDEMLLERLRGEAATIRKWVKVKKAGLTQAVVDQVHFVWRNNELALLKFDLPLCRNMHRAREIVEMKTGGVVVWSNKDFLAVYRGCNYKSGSKNFWNIHRKSAGAEENFSSTMNHRNTTTVVRVSPDGSGLDEMVREKDGEWESLHMPSLYEREADRLLDGLGPRFVDWWMQKPLPVDADLLPELVPGFKTPFRICPPFTRSKLTDAELTYLRKLARPLPTHFVLGRNRKLQGLAAAILKLWEKCHIAKIALKWGIPNTDNEQMANELKASVI